ncbi:MAG: VanW family protein [Acidimicrobiia bacterium]|nr:VanW family protein [Acidimicrobiia bacterium]
MSRWLVRTLLGVVIVVAVLLLGTVTAWGVDRVVHFDQVNRNVTFAGIPVGGMTEAEFANVLDRVALESAEGLVVVAAPGFDIVVTGAEAGISLDREAAISRVFAAGRDGDVVDSFTGWLDGMRDPLTVAPSFRLDVGVAAEMIRSAPGWVKQPPTEPSFTAATGTVVVTPGRQGLYLDADQVAEALAAEVAFGEPPFRVDVDWSPMPPRFDDSDVAEALSVVEDLTDTQLAVRINGRTAYVGSTTMLRWIDSELGSDDIVPVFNEDRVLESLERLLDGYATPVPQPTYLVEDGTVSYGLDGPPARTCCDLGAADVLYREAQRGGSSFVFLPTRLLEEDGGESRVETLGINELVSEFTTNHACCENRVVNIHMISDIVSGYVMQPGERFSVNGYVGERTREKGFVPAGSIQQGHLKDDVGGGVSQFATTLFNAAFFAGLDFDDYQSHTIYLSRYPFGREATINYPDVDLAFVNNTPYGILIWVEYTDTSITVQMYSTKYWDVEQTDQRTWRSGACRSVETFRSRTNPDGFTVEDSVRARYRPGEGLDCAGRPTPRP